MEKPKDCLIVIFGASGDLTKRKLMPSIYELYKQNVLPENFIILGVSRTDFNDDTFRQAMNESIKEFVKDSVKGDVPEFLEKLHYMSIDTKTSQDYGRLKERIDELNEKHSLDGNYIFYLATPPSAYAMIAQSLGEYNLQDQTVGFRRLVIEKPFGYDLESAVELNNELHKIFKENQIYRIDHYLGKETVQNLLVTRFSNGIFEPLWNRSYIHHVEVTSAESIGVENRGAYYDNAGALRDMVQNHLLQVMSFVAMEPPSSFASDAIRNETLKVYQSLRPIKEEEVEKYVIRGQYMASTIRGEQVKGYREEVDVNPESKTETYIAMKFYIDNWRWGGIPFYIRTGKRLPTRVTEVVIHFKPTPHALFGQTDNCETCNQLIIRIQPDEGILLKISMKVPGGGFELRTVNMDFHYKDLGNVHIPDAYERLIYDCMMGDSTLYSRGDVVEAAWKFLAPIQSAWKNNHGLKIYGYPAGTWGPENADELIEDKHVTWRYPCKNLSDDGKYCEL